VGTSRGDGVHTGEIGMHQLRRIGEATVASLAIAHGGLRMVASVMARSPCC
jgi:hypothetical protein